MNGARTQLFRRACQSLVGVGILNFVVFVAIASYLGGCREWQNRGRTVLRIRSTHGSGHKVYTEVSESVFNYSKLHVYTFWATWPLVMAATFAASRKQVVGS